jgi:hypothetical protein
MEKHKLERNSASSRISFEELIERLKIWIEVSYDDKLGKGFGNSPYWHFSYQNKCYVINSDTKRSAVRTFITKYENGDLINILPPKGSRKRTKMIIGEESITSLFIYGVN